MKLSLSVKISIKEIFPEKLIYNNYICLFTYNNFNGKINIDTKMNKNPIIHNVDCINSNIIYNLHIIDSNKNSLIGICQLIINFDKIKNLNINDTLTQEEKVKLIIDSKTKRKIFNNIYNIGEIYLNLISEIKIIDKNINELENKKTIKNVEEKDNNKYEYNNVTPRTYKTNEKFKSTKKDRETIKRVDTFSNYNQMDITDNLVDEILKNSTTNSTLQKNKSHQKINKRSIIKKNSKNINDLFNRHRAINSCIEMPSKCQNKINANLIFNKEDNQKMILSKSNRKNNIPKKKVTILNLIEEKLNPIFNKTKEIKEIKEDNIFEINEESKDFKNTSINFSKNQVNKVNINLKKYSSRTLKKKSIKNNENKSNTLNKKSSRDFDELYFLQKKNKNNKGKNKIKINLNINDKNKENKSISSINSEKEKDINSQRVNYSKILLNNTGRLNTDMNKNMNKLIINNNINTKINIGILQTEITNRKSNEIMNNSRRSKYSNKHILNDIDLEQLIIEKGAFIKGNFKTNIKEKNKGTFSPKISFKFKFKENNDFIKYDRYNSAYKQKKKQRILTPKGNQKKLISFLNNVSHEDNSYIEEKEKEEIKKKYVNLIDFYSLLSKKLRKTNKNNIEIGINFESMKEKYNYMEKQKNRLIQKLKNNESKQIINKLLYNNDNKYLINKMTNIKLKENSIYQDILGPKFTDAQTQLKIENLILQKKEMILNMIKNIVKFYGNISQIYNNDRIKKEKLQSILNKYCIKEKVKIDLNYITHIHKENNFEDKIITEVDEDKENEEDEEEIKPQNDINNQISNDYQLNENNIINISHDSKKIIKNTLEGLNNIYKEENSNNIENNNSYDENLNNLIKKILLEEFPVKYKTNMRFNYLDKNKYSFGNNIFFGFIENNDIILKEENNQNNNKYSLNEFYQNFCLSDKKENKSNFVYTKKIRQKYIKMKSNDKELSLDKKPKNESSTTFSDYEKRQQSVLSKLNEMGEMRNSMSDEKENV